MNLEGKNYKIYFENETLKISGKLALTPEKYEEIEDYFEKVLGLISEANKKELVLDLRELEFLNSSGIKSICVSLVMEADEIDGLNLKILCSNSFTWQVETIPTFKDLMDNLEIIFK